MQMNISATFLARRVGLRYQSDITSINVQTCFRIDIDNLYEANFKD